MNGPTRSRRPVDEYYLSLLASKNTVAPCLPSKSATNVAEPSTDAIYNAYLNRGPGFYRYVKRDSKTPQLLSWPFPQHRGEMKPLEVGNVPLTQGRHSRLI